MTGAPRASGAGGLSVGDRCKLPKPAWPASEVFFSIIQCKVLTPAVADNLEQLGPRILVFEPSIAACLGWFDGGSPVRSSIDACRRWSRAPGSLPHDPVRFTA